MSVKKKLVLEGGCIFGGCAVFRGGCIAFHVQLVFETVIGGCAIFRSGFAIFRIGFSLSTFFTDFLVETRDIIYSFSTISNARFTRNRLSGQMH